jgi:hypothetical protein
MHPHAPCGQQRTQRLRQRKRGGFGDRVGRKERKGGYGHRRQHVHDGAPRTSQQRQEGLGHAVGAEEVDGQVPFEHGRIAQVVPARHAGVIDEEIEGFDVLDSSLNLRSAGHVQGQGRDAPIRVGQGPAGTGIHARRAPAQGLGDQRLSNATIGPGHQDRRTR